MQPVYDLSSSELPALDTTKNLLHNLWAVYGMAIRKRNCSPTNGAPELHRKHFSGMSPRAGADTRMLNPLMFWPSLVQ